MQVILLMIVFAVMFKVLKSYEPTHKKIQRMDNDPNCTIKSDKWYREHDCHKDNHGNFVDNKTGDIINLKERR